VSSGTLLIFHRYTARGRWSRVAFVLVVLELVLFLLDVDLAVDVVRLRADLGEAT